MINTAKYLMTNSNFPNKQSIYENFKFYPYLQASILVYMLWTVSFVCVFMKYIVFCVQYFKFI